MKKIKEKFIGLICIVTVFMTTCFGGMSVSANSSTDITLDNAPEKDFTQWTFESVNLDDQPLTSDLNWERPAANAAGLDKTIFNGKILFPAGSGNDIGNFYIGGSASTSASLYSGFLIRGAASNALSLAFQDTSGTIRNIANLWEANTDTTLRGNANLQFSLSVEYLSEANDLVKAKVGVFFDGKLYNNTYYTVENLPKECLTQHIKWKSPANSPAIASHIFGDITLENAPEKDFDQWTFRDVNINVQTLTSDLNWERPAADTAGLDKTIFNGKILFPAGSGNDIGNFYIGGSASTSASLYSGFLIRGAASNALSLAFQDTSGTIRNIANLWEANTDTTLRGNANLQFSLSVEYLSEANGLVKAKVGVFFDGKLYNNTYYTVENLPKECLTKHIKWKSPANSPVIVSHIFGDITLENAPEKNFNAWTFRDVNIDDQPLTSDLNWTRPATGAADLDKTIFNGKILFPAGSGNDIGNFYIGGSASTSASVYSGFLIRGAASNAISLAFQDASGTIRNIANLWEANTDTTLRGNSNLQFSLSVEYLSEANGAVTARVGVFFNGKLYNNTYFTVENLPAECLTQHLKWKSPANSPAIASYPEITPEPTEDIYLETAPEKDFAAWTFSSVGIDDQTVTTDLNWGSDWESNTIGNSLDKTLFNGKINFANGAGDAADFYIGGADATDDETATTSKYGGLIFQTVGTTGLKLGYRVSGTNTIYPIAEFDSTTAEAELRGNADLWLAFSVEYLNVENEEATLKLGVFFNGKLYDGSYYTIESIPTKYLNQNIRLKAAQKNNVVASYPEALPEPEKEFEGINETYKELTLRDFSILNASVNKIEEGKDYRVENYHDWETLDGTAVSVFCNFPESGSARFSVGGSFWRGVYVGSCSDGKLEVCYVNTEGKTNRLTYLDAETAGVTTLTGKDVIIRLTFDVVETSATTSDLRLGVYVNGKLYDGKHCIVRNADTETLTRTFKIYAADTPFEIESIKTQPDLSIYGFDNKTWKSKI